MLDFTAPKGSPAYLSRWFLPGLGTYYCPNAPHLDQPTPPTVDQVQDCGVLFVDFDTPTAQLPHNFPRPSLSVETSAGKYHHYWFLDEAITPEEFTRLQAGLATICGSDPSVTNPNRLMRLPGTANLKEGAGGFVARVQQQSDRTHSPHMFRAIVALAGEQGVYDPLPGKGRDRTIVCEDLCTTYGNFHRLLEEVRGVRDHAGERHARLIRLSFPVASELWQLKQLYPQGYDRFFEDALGAFSASRHTEAQAVFLSARRKIAQNPPDVLSYGDYLREISEAWEDAEADDAPIPVLELEALETPVPPPMPTLEPETPETDILAPYRADPSLWFGLAGEVERYTVPWGRFWVENSAKMSRQRGAKVFDDLEAFDLALRDILAGRDAIYYQEEVKAIQKGDAFVAALNSNGPAYRADVGKIVRLFGKRDALITPEVWLFLDQARGRNLARSPGFVAYDRDRPLERSPELENWPSKWVGWLPQGDPFLDYLATCDLPEMNETKARGVARKITDMLQLVTPCAETMVLAWIAQAWGRWHGEGVADLALIIQGEEGIGKTSVSQAIAGGFQFYAEVDNFDLSGERPLAHLHGTRVVDVCEGAAFHKSSAASFKRFMSLRELKITPKYSNTCYSQPATWLTIGSVNSPEFLRYEGSNRRLIVVQSGAAAKSFDWEQHLGDGRDHQLFLEFAAAARWLHAQGISPQSLLSAVEAERVEALERVEDSSPDQDALDDFVDRYSGHLETERSKLASDPTAKSCLGEMVGSEFVPYALPLNCAEFRKLGILPRKVTTEALKKAGLTVLGRDRMAGSGTRSRGVALGGNCVPLPKHLRDATVFMVLSWYRI